MLIPVDLYEIRIDEKMQEQIVVLKEREGDRLLPIVIGIFEAHAIQMKIAGLQFPRPMTHDLLLSVFHHLGAKIDSVVVSNLENRTFYAQIHVEQDGKEINIDSRPSDAIALAVRDSTPLYVEESVFDAILES